MGNPTTVKLNNGNDMPLVGFGLWKVTNETCADQVYNAIKVGYRLFDGAYVYGNEKETGQGFARAMKEGLVKRSDLFIVSKLWNYFHEKDRVVPICKKQLADYGIDYFDLYVVHFPIALKYVDPSVKYPPDFLDETGKCVPIKAPLHQTWAGMEQLVDQGLSKNIGVSNYNGGLMLDLMRYARIMPQALQIEHHPYLGQQQLVDLCQKNGIAITAYSSFGAQSYIELESKKAINSAPLLESAAVKKVADAHGKTPAQVLLRWATQRKIAVIPKSNNPGRLAANLDVTQWDLTPAEMKEVTALDRNLRFNDPLDDGFPLPIFF